MSGKVTAAVAAAALVVFCCDAFGAAAKKRPVPKKTAPESMKEPLLRSIPSWTELKPATAAGEADAKGKKGKAKGEKAKGEKAKEADAASVFGAFPDTAEMKGKKPFVVYFYWPDEEKPSTLAKSCALFEKKLAQATGFKAKLADFGRYTCNAKELDKKLRALYAPRTPVMNFFDPTGRKVYALAAFPSSEKALLAKVDGIKKASDKITGTTAKKEAPSSKKGSKSQRKGAAKKGGDEEGPEEPEGGPDAPEEGADEPEGGEA